MNRERKPSVIEALVPMIVLIVLLFCGVFLLEASPHIPMLSAGVFAILFAMLVLKYSWDELLKGILAAISSSMPAILILLVVGMVIGTWISSGVVPAMIYYGLQIISPSILLVSAVLITSVVSLTIGSSWTAAATVGVALMGIGTSMGIPSSIVGGAVISGAYFGDKMSPLSETTNLAPAIAGCTLPEHIRHLLYTTMPSYIISLVFFGLINLRYGGGEANQESIAKLFEGLHGQFAISPALLLVPVLVIVMVLLKVPALISLFAGAALGGLFAMLFQGATLAATVNVMHYGYTSESGNAIMDELLTRGGLNSMLWTISLIIIAMVFAGVLERTGMVRTLTEALARFTRTTGSLAATTIVSCIGINAMTGEQYLSIVIPGRMYKQAYEEKGLHMKNLSRVLEDAGTLTSPLFPWNGCGAFMIATLGLAPWTYVPYCFLNLINPIVSALYGFTGLTMEKAPVAEGEREE